MKILIYVEGSTSFNRYDIIDRIRKLSKHSLYIGKVYILIPRIEYVEVYTIISGSMNRDEIHDTLLNIINNILSICHKPIILSEDGVLEPHMIVYHDCFIAGLHTDIPRSIVETLVETRAIKSIKLSNIPYLASSLIPIIDYLHVVRQ